MKRKHKLSPGEKGLLFLLGLFLLFRLPFWFAAWQMRRAIDSFDAHETDFIIETSLPLPHIRLRSDQLSPDQLDLLQRYVNSYRFERTAFLREFNIIDGGPRISLDFRTPYGQMFLREDQVYWEDPFGGRWAAQFRIDPDCTRSLVNLVG